MRDDFSEGTKDTLAKRVGMHCSNPDCRKPTSGPRDDPAKAVNIGVAAHITAASPDGPRFDQSFTPADLQLHRARLFREKAELAKARVIIERCSYWRRKTELEDAEEAANQWPAIIKIHSATYGAGDILKDVADFLRGEITYGHRRIPVTNRLTGGKDPCEFSKKKLTIEYDRDGKRQREVVAEGDELDLA